MMGKIKLIIAREYLSRIKNRTFILVTLLVPIMYGVIMGVSIYMASKDSDKELDVKVVDQSGLFTDEFESEGKTTFSPLSPMSAEDLEGVLNSGKLEGVGLFIPKDVKEKPDGVKLYYEDHPGSGFISKLERIIEQKITRLRMKDRDIDKELLTYVDVDVDISTKQLGEDGAKESNVAAATTVAYASGFLLYFFIFIYGSMVLRGVQEEKTSRIVEVIISSVKPFQLMMGKIMGNGLLGLTQFAIWILMISGIFIAIQLIFGVDVSGAQPPMAMEGAGASPEEIQGIIDSMKESLNTLPILQIVVYFILFFLGGYFLYSTLFAAVAAAVDSQQDVQQFMLPISIPLILSMMFLSSIIQDPNGSTATILSMIPFTSPVIMAARIPFGIEWYEPLISLAILFATFIGGVFVAGKVYRIGLLMYGSKPSWKQLIKWVFSKN